MDPFFSGPIAAIAFFICCSCGIVFFGLAALVLLVRLGVKTGNATVVQRAEIVDAEYTVNEQGDVIYHEVRTSKVLNSGTPPDVEA